MKHLFITGAARSGTTLLASILDAHPSLRIYSQPFPLLFVRSKERFHDAISYTGEQMPLANYGGDHEYLPDDVTQFLETDIIDTNVLSDVFDASKRYSGTKSKIQFGPDTIKNGTFFDIYSQLLNPSKQNAQVTHSGSKEILCEEFIPYFLTSGIKSICIIRDPRDVMTSMNHGSGKSFTGDYRPTLFNIHNWRKSVYFSLHYKDHPDFLFLKYEDIVTETTRETERISHFLELGQFPTTDFDGDKTWSSNSSFGSYTTISDSSINRYKKTLPPQVQAYIEATCYAEMKYLGYTLSHPFNPESAKEVIQKFNEPYIINRDLPRKDYSRCPEKIINEIDRIQYLSGRHPALPTSFLYPDIGTLLLAGIYR